MGFNILVVKRLKLKFLGFIAVEKFKKPYINTISATK